MRILPILAFLLRAFLEDGWAVGATNGFTPNPKNAVTNQERKAILKSIDGAECIYSTMGDRLLMLEWEPEIFDVPDNCTGNKRPSDKAAPAQKSICFGTVVCRTPFLTFAFEKAKCWSRDGKHCPPPGKCAAQSFVGSLEMFDSALGRVPLYHGAEPRRSTR